MKDQNQLYAPSVLATLRSVIPRRNDVTHDEALRIAELQANKLLAAHGVCGNCGSRLIITNSKNRSGTVYPYFICLGRHQKTTDCQMKAVLISVVEELVEKHYLTVRLDPELAEQIRSLVRDDVATYRSGVDRERSDLTKQKVRLESERMRLLQAHYAGAVPIDLLKQEQDRIAHSLSGIESRLSAANIQSSAFDSAVERALRYAVNAERAYRAAATRAGGRQARRLLNQAFFKRILVHEHHVTVEFAEPFDTILSVDIAAAARGHAHGQRNPTLEAEDVPLSALTSEDIEKPAPCGAGLNVTALVRFYAEIRTDFRENP